MALKARSKLARLNPDSLHYWSLAHRRIGGAPFELAPALAALYDDRSEFLVIQKAAQMGISEYLLNTALFVSDARRGERGVSLYLMPTAQMANDFSQGRIERAIQDSPYLQKRTGGNPSRSGLRQVGDGLLYVRGAESDRLLLSVDADFVAFDELDHMSDGVVELGIHRLDSSRLRWARLVSTPTVPNAMINERFLEGDQRYWFIRCERCGRSQTLTWEDNVDKEEGLLHCSQCGGPLNNQSPGEWVAARPGASYPSYHLSQLYSPHLRLEALIEASRSTNPYERQQFHNSSLGIPYLEEGSGITMEVLEACMDDPSGWPQKGELAMGVDVGAKNHFVIRRRVGNRFYLIEVGSRDSLSEIGSLIQNYEVRRCVIDAQPENHAARELVNMFPGRVSLCYYSESVVGRRHERSTYHVNRTYEIDEVVSRFRSGSNRIALNHRYAGGNVRANRGEYLRQLMGETRVFQKDSTDNPVARYKGRGNSHWLHAEVYCSLASLDLPGVPGLKAAVAPRISWMGPEAGLTISSRLSRSRFGRRFDETDGQRADYTIRFI